MLFIILAIPVLIALIIYILMPHPPKTPQQVENIAQLETHFNQLIQSGSPPGLSVVVVNNEEVVYIHSFGYADAPKGIKVTPDTVYHWWSMTKIPTAIAVMQLQEIGKLDLDDEVVTHLPWFEVQYPSSESATITIRHLLQHSSGLPDTIPAMVAWVHYDDALRDQTELVKKYLPKYNKVKFEPGTNAAYSNFNYMVLGALIEAVSDQSYEEYIKESILQPLGMSQTGFVYTPAMSEHEAIGTMPIVHMYTLLLPFLLDSRALIRERMGNFFWMNRVYIDATPSTGLIGSGNDLARFMIGYLSSFTLEGEPIVSPESLATLNKTGPINGRGLGWSIGESTHGRVLEHGGGGPGFATVMRLFPERGLGITILANGTDLDREGLLNLLTGLDW